jgi:dienelactone hydrolase
MNQETEALWQQRFRLRRIYWSQVADAASDRGLVVTSDANGVIQLHAWDVPTGALVPLTHAPHGVGAGIIAPGGDFIYYLDDDDGDESGRVVRVAFEGGEPEDVLPGIGPLALVPGGMAISRNGTCLAFLTSDQCGFALLVRDLDESGDSSPRELFRTDAFCWQPTLSADGNTAVLASTEQTAGHHFGLIALDCATGDRIAELRDGPAASHTAEHFSPVSGDDRLLGTTTRTGHMRPLIWNPRSGERIDIELPDVEGDVLPLDWSGDGRSLLLCQIHRAQYRLYTYDLTSGATVRLDHPGGSITTTGERGAQFMPDGEIWADWQDATHPGQVIALDSASGKLRRTQLAADDPPPSHRWRSVEFSSADGASIQGWLAQPAGNGPFPAVVHLHGGPEDVQNELFYPSAQAWVDHGFAFFSVNFRGSTTFGQHFQEQIWGNLGHWEMQDIVAARAWLVDHGIAAPDRIFLTGWSYGGFLTLLGIGRHPELWAGGMAGAVISDWTALYDDSADFIRGYLASIMDGTPADKPNDYAQSSPITYAADVAVPVLIIQGRNDVRTPARQAELYLERLTSLGKPVEVVWYDSGHVGASMDADQAIAHQERMMRFALNILAAPSALR